MRTYPLYIVAAVCIILLSACGTPSPFPMSFPNSQAADDRVVGNWMMVEDTNKHNFYEVTKRDDPHYEHQYHVRFFNRGGTNPTYEANIFLSDFGRYGTDTGIKFINVPYVVDVDGKGDFGMGWENRGYFLVRILEADKGFTKLTTATVNHSALPGLRRAVQLEIFMRDHINDPKIYSDTVHFYKVNEPTAQLRRPR